MKKLWNSIAVTILVFFSIIICTSHIANKFFQKDIGSIVFREVNVNAHIQELFTQLETYIPNLDKDAFRNLTNEIEHNAEASRIIGEASKSMLDDIVHHKTENQDMKEVLKDLIYSYDETLKKVVEPMITVEEVHSFLEEGLKYTPIQEVYDIAVESVQSSVPTSYMKVMKFVNFISQEIIFYGSMGISALIVLLLFIFNRHHLAWTFSIGMGGLISGAMLLVAGQVVPVVYQNMLGQLDYIVSSVSSEDFQWITYYAIGYLIIGVCCLGGYFLITKKKNENRGSVT